MSLKDFHIVFITASILLSLGFACWTFIQYKQLHEVIYAGVSFASFLFAVGLLIYEVSFVKKTRS